MSFVSTKISTKRPEENGKTASRQLDVAGEEDFDDLDLSGMEDFFGDEDKEESANKRIGPEPTLDIETDLAGMDSFDFFR